MPTSSAAPVPSRDEFDLVYARLQHKEAMEEFFARQEAEDTVEEWIESGALYPVGSDWADAEGCILSRRGWVRALTKTLLDRR